MVLATCDKEDSVSQRSVVLRAVERDRSITFYTDQRSEKLRVINENDQVSLLFYDAEEKVQVACKGYARSVDVDSSQISNYNLRSVKDYTTTLPPGSVITSPEYISYNHDKVYFAIVTIVLSAIDYVKLGKEYHVRISFKKIGDRWEGQYLVP